MTFDFDLLKVDSDHLTQHFFNLLFSSGLLPHILQPTRVTDHSTTVIDNIFSNNLQDDISGNVLLTISEHFAQIISVNREQIDIIKMNVYQRDYSKFIISESFQDVSIQNWNYSNTNVNDSFKDFYTKHEASLDKTCPTKDIDPKGN